MVRSNRAEAEPAGPAGGGRLLVAAVVVVLGVVFVVHAAPWIGRGFGYSLDGFNGAVWGQGARAAVDEPIASRLGGIQPDGHRYANHPPLTVWTATVMSAASGDSPVAVRLPAVLASLLTLGVLALLLRDGGASPPAVVVGLTAAGTCSMFLAYGAMLDTPVVSLPCGLAALAAAQRAWLGRSPPALVLAVSGALAGLSGWQASALAVVAVVLCALVARRAAAWLAAGAAAGGAVTLGWIGWVHGSLRPLLDQATFRAGTSGVQVSWATAQQRHLGELFGPVLVAVVVVGLVAAVVPRRGGGSAPALLTGTRPLALALVVVVVGYTAGFRNGSTIHDYWTFWGVALVAVGVTALADRVVALVAHRGVTIRLIEVGACAVALVVGVGGVTRGSPAEDRIRAGLDLLPVIEEAPDAEEPTDTALAVYDQPGTLPWADYAVDGRAVHADDPVALRALPPDLPVLVVLRDPPSAALQERAIAVNDRFALVPAAELADHLGG